jgi:hypothetical protein
MSPSIRADPAPTGIRPLPDGTFGNAHPDARTLSVDPTKMRVRSVISTIDPDRAGDVVVPTGLRNLDEFLLNPVGFWTISHNSEDTHEPGR